MARYTIIIDDEDRDDPACIDTPWTASLAEDDGNGNIGEIVSGGIGATPREAVNDIDWHHDWTRHLIELDNRNNTR